MSLKQETCLAGLALTWGQVLSGLFFFPEALIYGEGARVLI